jgi:fatty-acyl-CoA synthase
MAHLERPETLTLSQALDARVEGDGDRVFLFHGGERVTFGDVAGDSRALARALAGLGVEPGDRVALILPGCPEFVCGLFALSRLGVTAVPLDPRLTAPELRYLLRHSEAVAAITVERFGGVDFLELFEDLLPKLPALQYLVTVGEEDLWYDDRIFQFEDIVSAGRGRPVVEHPVDPAEGVAALMYTSGTTGKPKAVELTHAGLLAAAGAAVDAIGLGRDDRVIGVMALYHVFALAPGILGSVVSGSSLILQAEFEPEEALDLIEALGATVHYGVPTVFAAELRAQRARPRDLSSLRRGVVAGAPMLEELRSRVEAELCPALLTAYSLTETSSVLAMTRPDDPEAKRRLTVGRPVPGTEVRVLDRIDPERAGTSASDASPPSGVLPEESLGEIAVRGPGVMRGYYRQPRETARAFTADGFLLTGDLGIVDEDGYVHLVGRQRDVILRSGSNVHPGEIEDRLQQHPAVEEAAVVGIRDELLGEAICAAIVAVEGAIVNEDELRSWCGETLADHKIPDFVRFLDSLPMTGTGKIRRVELARLLEAERSSDRN